MNFVGAVTKMIYAEDEAKRMAPAPGNVAGGWAKSIAGSATAAEAAVEAAKAKAKAAEEAIDKRLEVALGREGSLPLDSVRAHLEECLGDEEECELPKEPTLQSV